MNPDGIMLRGIQAVGRHGVLPEEQERAQPFEVDVEIELDLAEAARRDELSATIDYGAVIAEVVAIVEHGHFALLEALAGAIAERVLEAGVSGGGGSGAGGAGGPGARGPGAGAQAVTVEVRKLRPPVAALVGTVGVRIRRVRV